MNPASLLPIVPILVLLALILAIAFIAKHLGLFGLQKPASEPQYKKKADGIDR